MDIASELFTKTWEIVFCQSLDNKVTTLEDLIDAYPPSAWVQTKSAGDMKKDWFQKGNDLFFC